MILCYNLIDYQKLKTKKIYTTMYRLVQKIHKFEEIYQSKNR